MQIMCLNGWGGKMHDQLLPYLAQIQPDVLCLQEVVHSPATDKDTLTYRDGDHILPQRANFFADVCRALPDHAATFCPAAQGALWDGDRPVPSQWGLATFVRRSIPVIGQAQGFVHKGFSADGFGDHPRSRSAHVVRVYDLEQDQPLTVAHMHGLRDLTGKHDTPERFTQAHTFKDIIASVAEPNDPLIVCGDFNVLPDSETFDILGQLGLTDLVTSRNFPGTRNSQYTKPQRFADYMMVNAPLSDARFDVIYDPEVSDHCPLVLHTD